MKVLLASAVLVAACGTSSGDAPPEPSVGRRLQITPAPARLRRALLVRVAL